MNLPVHSAPILPTQPTPEDANLYLKSVPPSSSFSSSSSSPTPVSYVVAQQIRSPADTPYNSQLQTTPSEFNSQYTSSRSGTTQTEQRGSGCHSLCSKETGSQPQTAATAGEGDCSESLQGSLPHSSPSLERVSATSHGKKCKARRVSTPSGSTVIQPSPETFSATQHTNEELLHTSAVYYDDENPLPSTATQRLPSAAVNVVAEKSQQPREIKQGTRPWSQYSPNTLPTLSSIPETITNADKATSISTTIQNDTSKELRAFPTKISYERNHNRVCYYSPSDEEDNPLINPAHPVVNIGTLALLNGGISTFEQADNNTSHPSVTYVLAQSNNHCCRLVHTGLSSARMAHRYNNACVKLLHIQSCVYS